MNRFVVGTAVAFMLAASSALSSDLSHSHDSNYSRVQIGFKFGANFASMSGGLWGMTQFMGEQLRDDPAFTVTGGYSESGLSGVVTGGLIGYRLSDAISLQMEILYSKKGTRAHGVATWSMGGMTFRHDIEEKLELSYWEFPVLLKYAMLTGAKLRPAVYVGPAISFTASSRDKMYDKVTGYDGVTSYSLVIEGKPKISNMNGTDVGIALGSELSYKISSKTSLLLDLRYTLGVKSQFGPTNLDNVPSWVDGKTYDEFPIVINSANGGVAKSVPDKKNRTFSITAGLLLDI